MILEVDMGNTRIKWRVRTPNETLARGSMDTEGSLDSIRESIFSYLNNIDSVLVASVVGDELERRFSVWALSELSLEPKFARSSPACGRVRNGYSEPLRLGVDRWLAINAAYRLVNDACIVISGGTAITVDLVSREGQHLGGFIAPGFRLMLGALASGTRKVELESRAAELNLLPGVTTTDAVYSACTAMIAGLIENGIQQLRAHGVESGVQMVFTGGDAERFMELYPQARLVPELVLDGLGCVFGYS